MGSDDPGDKEGMKDSIKTGKEDRGSGILSKVSSQRSFIMGIAILWVMTFHIKDYMPGYGFIQEIGYGGVDLFILLSGFGCWYSLEKSDDILGFFQRRMIRILPSYLPFIIIWMAVRFVTYQLYFTEMCGNLTMTGWWNNDGNQFNWYVDAILLFYLLAPYLYKAISGSKKPLRVTVFLLMLSLIISFSFMHGLLLIGISRLPIFIMGMFLGKVSGTGDRSLLPVSDKVLVISGNILMAAGFGILYYFLKIQSRWDNWHYGLWWYPFILIAPGLVFDLALAGDLLSKTKISKIVSRVIEEVGKASFEIFLIHIFLFETFGNKADHRVLPLLFTGALILGYGYYRLITRILRNRSRFNP